MSKRKKTYVSPQEMKNRTGAIIDDFVKNEVSRVNWGMSPEQVRNVVGSSAPILSSAPGSVVSMLPYQGNHESAQYLKRHTFYSDELCASEIEIPAWCVKGASMMAFVDLHLSMVTHLASAYGDAHDISRSPLEGQSYRKSEVSSYWACWKLPDFLIDFYLHVPEENQPLETGLLNLDFHNSQWDEFLTNLGNKSLT